MNRRNYIGHRAVIAAFTIKSSLSESEVHRIAIYITKLESIKSEYNARAGRCITGKRNWQE